MLVLCHICVKWIRSESILVCYFLFFYISSQVYWSRVTLLCLSLSCYHCLLNTGICFAFLEVVFLYYTLFCYFWYICAFQDFVFSVFQLYWTSFGFIGQIPVTLYIVLYEFQLKFILSSLIWLYILRCPTSMYIVQLFQTSYYC